MKRYALAATLALSLGSGAQAAVIDLNSNTEARNLGPPSASVQARVSDLAPTTRDEIVLPPANMSELPEPEVFAMMLVGLILIGYRAGRDRSEKFK